MKYLYVLISIFGISCYENGDEIMQELNTTTILPTIKDSPFL